MTPTMSRSCWVVSVLSISPLLAMAQNSTAPIYSTLQFTPCDVLSSKGLSNRILLPTSPLYEPQVQSYWAANTRLHPWCFFLPQTTQEISTALTALSSTMTGNETDDWHIAVRSGGHSYPGSNNIEKGLTIDLSHMNNSWYDPSTNLASLEPGARWRNVYTNLLNTANVTVTGGRDGDVGVGGFLLGGGNSYYSGKNGFACDTVANYEVVLINGTVVRANAQENSDLYRALKGGGSNFGLVSRFDMMAIPAVDLAYGQSVIASNHSNEVIDAVVEFTDRASEQRADHLIALYMHSPGNPDLIVAIRVNTEGDLNTTSFDTVTKIPSLKSSWARESLAAAADSSQTAGGTHNVGFTLTFLNDPSILRQTSILKDQLVTTLSLAIGPENFEVQMFFQPLPAYYHALGEQTGGNVLGLNRTVGGNAVMYTAGVGVISNDDSAFAIAQAEMSSMIAKLKEFTVAHGKEADFVYLNYADKTQDPLGSYGPENVGFMKEVAMRYDPGGMWERMVPGGFKLARVGL